MCDVPVSVFIVCIFFGRFSRNLCRVRYKRYYERRANRQCLAMCACDVPQTEEIALNIATQLDHQFNKVPQIKGTSWRPSP